MRCKECALIFTHREDIQPEHYSRHYTEIWAKEWRGEEREVIFQEALSYLPMTDGDTLLDVGCGGGKLISMAAQAGWNVWGVDPSLERESWAFEMVRERIVPVLDMLPPNLRFQAVCCLNVLDQVHHSWGFLKPVYDRMTQGSLLVIRLPNCRLHRAIHQLANPLPPLVRRHLLSNAVMHEYGMEPVFLRRMLVDTGFDHVRMLPSIASLGDVYDQGKQFMFIKRILAPLLYAISRLTGGKLLLTPSIFVIAHKRDIA